MTGAYSKHTIQNSALSQTEGKGSSPWRFYCKSNYVDDVICYIGIFVVIVVGISFLNELELVICNGRRCVSGRE